MSYPDKPPPAGFRLQPEVAADFPSVSRDRRTFTFRLRNGFRFSDGSPVRASAFARAINRMLAPEMNSPGVQFVRDIVGAGQVRRRQGVHASGVVARGNTLVVRLTRPAPDFPSRTASTVLLRRAADAADRRRRASERSRGRAVLRRRLPARRAGRAATEPRSTAEAGLTMSTASTSISAPRRRRRCCDASIEERPTGATRSRGSTSIPRSGSSRSTGSTARNCSAQARADAAHAARSTPRGRCSATIRGSARRSTSRSTAGRSSSWAASIVSRAERSVPAPEPARVQGRGRLSARAPEPGSARRSSRREACAAARLSSTSTAARSRWRSDSS